MLRSIAPFVLSAGVFAGCSCAAHEPARSRPDRVYTEDGGPLPDASGVIGDLPCGVADVVVRSCITCHGSDPAIDAHPLLAADDFRRAADSDPTRTVGAVAVERMRLPDGDRMPPSPAAAVPESDIAAIEAWVSAGMPSGECGVRDPFDVPPVCTSGLTSFVREGPSMTPGQACIACHTARRVRDAAYTLAGTAYPTAHEPDRCIAALPEALTIEVTDAMGRIVRMTPNAAGNFFSSQPVTFPITARAISSRGAYEMTTAVGSGDCNGCHTQAGTTTAPPADPPPPEAPGRIIAP